MADDSELYELAVKFPEAALALVGIHPTVRGDQRVRFALPFENRAS